MISQTEKAVQYLTEHPGATYSEVRAAVGCSQGIVRTAKQIVGGQSGQSVVSQSVRQPGVGHEVQNNPPHVGDGLGCWSVGGQSVSQSVDRETALSRSSRILDTAAIEPLFQELKRQHVAIGNWMYRHGRFDRASASILVDFYRKLKQDNYE